MRRPPVFGALCAAIAFPALLAGCDSTSSSLTAAPAPTPAPVPTPTPTPTPTSFDVTPCLNQQVAPGVSVASLVVPDVVSINLQQPSGFPNGRRLADPVVDVTLAVLFLDLRRHSPLTLSSIPLDPNGNDVPLRATFPYFAPPQGAPPISSGTAASFNFRTDPEAAYSRVDRMGMPAVATALISSPQKIPYNDANPADDAAGTFVPDITATLTGLTNALADDLGRLNLTPCATPI